MRFTATQRRTGAGIGVAAAVALGVVAGSRMLSARPRVHVRRAVAAWICVACGPRLFAGSADPPAIREEALENTLTPAPPARPEAVTLGQAFDAYAFLKAAGLTETEARAWARRLESVTHDARLLPGHRLLLYRARDTGALRGLRYDLGARASVVEEALGAGAVLVRPQSLRYQTRRTTVAFAINKSFYQDAEARGLSAAVITSIRQALGRIYPLDFAPPGAVVKVVYEQQMSSDGFYRRPEELKAARLIAGERSYVVLSFDEGGRARTYDEHGTAISPSFLRYPLRFNYVSSRFSLFRYHPILRRFRPHLGVDLAARYGTPVRAVGDGEIESAQWESELGRCIRIRHENGLVTLYGHLSRVKAGVRPGARVRAGQVIGLVGSSGLSTGAHLHFAILKDGRYVNPLTAHLDESNEIPAYLRPRFRSFRQKYLAALNQVNPPFHELVSVEAAQAQPPPFAAVHHVSPRMAEGFEQNLEPRDIAQRR